MSSTEIKQLVKHIKNTNPGLYTDSNILIKIFPIYFDDGYNTVWKVYYFNMNKIKNIHVELSNMRIRRDNNK